MQVIPLVGNVEELDGSLVALWEDLTVIVPDGSANVDHQWSPDDLKVQIPPENGIMLLHSLLLLVSQPGEEPLNDRV